jgi:hypothetical protein
VGAQQGVGVKQFEHILIVRHECRSWGLKIFLCRSAFVCDTGQQKKK